MATALRLLNSAVACVILAACGGGGSSPPQAPSPPITPTTPAPPPPPDRWKLSAQVVQYATNRPLAGARVVVAGGTPITTDADGRIELAADTKPGETPLSVTIEAAGHLTRQTFLRWERGARETTVDLIPDGRPFSAPFFRQLLRDAYDAPANLQPFKRWTQAPRFYLRTVDQTGRAIEPEVLAVVRNAIPLAVTDFTGGLMTAALEEGTETPPSTTGWVRVLIMRDPAEEVCGRAFVGANPGRITLYSDTCNCGSVKVPAEVVAHEVGHALGFHHVSDRRSVMYPYTSGGCPAGVLSADERYHAPLAYRRSPGHLEPDTDTDVTPLSAGRPIEVAN